MGTFATRLKQCLDDRGEIPAALARSAGIKPSSVSDWMTGKTSPENVKAEPLLRAAAFLHVNPMWLLTGTGAKAPHSATVLLAAEPSPPPYSVWPFPRVPPETYNALPSDTRARIEAVVDGVLIAQPSTERKA